MVSAPGPGGNAHLMVLLIVGVWVAGDAVVVRGKRGVTDLRGGVDALGGLAVVLVLARRREGIVCGLQGRCAIAGERAP